MLEIDVDFDDDEPAFKLRGRQEEWLNTIDADLPVHKRVLVVAPGGIGKGSLLSALAGRFHARGKKTLVLANRDRLTRQTADRIRDITKLDVELEMGEESASPFAPIVMACVQSLMRMNRLTGFSDDHFGLIVADECHLSLANGWQRILNYFHYGKESLQDDWNPPPDGTYEAKALVAGFTATPDIGDKKNLGEFYSHRSVNYTYLEAVNDGWLVAPIQKSIPVKVDLRKYKTQRGPNGNDFKVGDLSEALEPIIDALAEQISIHAAERKTIAFLPSVECSKMMSEALALRGMNSIYVSGECVDGDEKTELFRSWGEGSVMSNAQLFNYGIDFPDVDCVAWMRATLSKAFYVQGVYRGTRVLPGVIDGLTTAEERREAIANSAKPNLLILDPLFVSDRIDLMDAYSLFTDKPEVRERMKNGDGLSAESAQKAERDFLKSLEREAKRTANRKARTFDPLAFAVSIGEESLSTWQPTSTADLRPPTKGQLEFLKRQHADTTHIKYFYQAQKLIGRLVMRMEAGLATPNQLSFLAQLGFNEQDASKLTIAQAGAVIDQIKRKKSA